MRYELYGVNPAEHADDNSDTKSDDQALKSLICVYTTDDKEEAVKIVRETGFISSTKGYIAVQGALDTETGRTIGLIPEDLK